MIISMDLNLNASPLPEEDEEDVFDGQVQESAFEERAESAVETMRREREERRQRMKREYPDESPKTKTIFKSQKRDPVVQHRNFRSYDKSKLPPGWLDCPSVGKPIIDLLVPSKVPLGDDFNDSVIPGKRYSLRHVIQQRARELGLVIDLTNTTRYYNAADWKKQGIKHFKIACRGRDSVPENQSVNKFVWEVFQFKARRKQFKKYILVHCTHGHNRTGYMIVHYLIRFERFSVTEAIQAFAQARPPGIYKQDYIDALYRFYHERKPESITCPPTPEWKRSSDLDLDLNGEAPPDEDDDGAAVPLHEDHVAAEVMTNDDILGDIIPDDQQEAMRQICYQFLKMGIGVKGTSQFPGSHPVSLNRDNLQTLRTRYYYATWKADGTRYMMLITNDGCYLIDRNFCFRRVQMRFPLKQTNEKQANEAGTHNFTLLDGEMVIDTLPDTHKQERRYLIYDLMAITHTSVVERPFCERWKMLEKEVIEPRNLERQFIHLSKVPYYRYEMEPFRVRRKDFWLLSTVTKLLKEFIPRLSHEADGLIFQGWDDPYVTRTHEGLLKWKYPEMNSVDFLFEVTEDNNELLFLYERGRKKLMEGRNKVEFRDGSEPLAYSGKIIECSWDSVEEVWIFLRARTDKSTPNDFNTYRKVMRSIKDNITEEVLLNEIVEIIRLPMYADRIRSDSKARMHRHSGRRS